jgi:peroxiredoxin family protein
MENLSLLDVDITGRSTAAPSLHENLRAMESQIAKLSQAAERRDQGVVIIAFSGEMDRLMAAFMLATGAAAMGMNVTMFFTFWGLVALKRKTSFKGKCLLDRILTVMLSAGPGRLGLSKLNLFGVGQPFLNWLMRKRHVEPLGNLICLAREMNVRIVACQTAMELLGIARDELLEGIEFGGVATCLDSAQRCGTTLML